MFGFYNALIKQIQQMNLNGFLNADNMNLLLHEKTIEKVFEKMNNFTANKLKR